MIPNFLINNLNINISNNIPLNPYEVVEAIHTRQSLPWNYAKTNDSSLDILDELFKIINSGIPKEDFMYQGNLFRIHTPYVGLYDDIDKEKEFAINKPCSDGSCSILTYTRYEDRLVSFSKSPNFTKDVYYKICPTLKSNLFYANTKEKYGIDINVLTLKFGGYNPRLKQEYEVLFPLQKDFIIKEYLCTPNQFKNYMKKFN